MTVSRFEGREAGIDANIGGRLIDTKTQARNFDSGIMEREEVCEGELGGRHGGLGVRIIVCFSICFAFVGSLKFSWQRPMVRTDVSTNIESMVEYSRGEILLVVD